MSSKPQIVFVPGAWNSPEGLTDLVENLESHGYTTHTCQLPSVGSKSPPKDLLEDIKAVQDVIEKAIGNGNDVIVASHSWGGIVVSSAAVGYDKTTRQAQNFKGGVVRLAYMASFLLPEGVSMINACGDQVPEFINIEGPYAIVKDSTALFNDLPAVQKQYWTSKLQSHSFASMEAKSTGAAWRTIPTSYLVCEDDHAIPASAQEAMIKSAREAGATVNYETLNTGHFPFLTRSSAVAEYVRRAAGEAI
ncbi:Alpha/beta hydrolase fold-1 [Boeremia exigua]|uniref:Alpha/beta hydrolase fold-1 n=1 Tax=Boeremia exigua TaxID=749465 RepID=UPI001E8CA0CC|nr:Alpha/beta hydrolase fold-1 [Boeremia exigua]KAH6625548.1 Alpha/beta hydrolase fold-1 [Boeremia exigua]